MGVRFIILNMNRFIIVITAYNAEEFIVRCINSAINQNYPYFSVVVVDDNSNDDTLKIILKEFKDTGIHLIANQKREGSAVANMKKAISVYAERPEDIIVCLDGDDYLYDNEVLSHLDSVYHPDIWLTYGQNISLSGKHDRISMPLTAVRTWKWEQIRTISLHTWEYRTYGLWHTSHLRTFRKGLFDRVKDEDLRYSDGEYFKTCCDVCVMYPMIEMAGDKHIQYVDRILYVYNDISGYGNRAEENMRNMEYIQSKPCYEEITDYRGKRVHR